MGQFRHRQTAVPTSRGVAVDGQGYVYVADTENFRVQKFTSIGVYIKSSGTQVGTRPWRLAVDDGKGIVYVVQTNPNAIEMYTLDLTPAGQWGPIPYTFTAPGVAVDG